MIKVGITGGIGSGKSTVCKIFNLLGVPVFYADDEAKALYSSNATLKLLIVENFGKELYKNGIFDRSRMKGIIFENPTKRQLLNDIVHPIVKAASAQWLQTQKGPYALKEAALLIESGSYLDLDEIIFVECPLNLRIERVAERDQLTNTEVMKRIEAQMPDEEKKKFAQHTILNDDQHLLIPQVVALHQYFIQKAK